MPEERPLTFLDSHSLSTQINHRNLNQFESLSNPINSIKIPRKLSTFHSSQQQQQQHNNTSSIPILHSHSASHTHHLSISDSESNINSSTLSNRRARSAEPVNPDRSTDQAIQASSPQINSPRSLKPDHQLHQSSHLKKSMAEETHPRPTMHPPPRPTTCESAHKKSDHSSPSKFTPGRTDSLTRISNHSPSFSNPLPPILSAPEHLQSHPLLRSQRSGSSISPPRNPITLCSSDSPSPVSFTSHSVPLDHSSPTPSAPTQVPSNPLSRIRTALTPPPFQSPVRTPLTCTSQSSVSKLLHSSNSYAFTNERAQSKAETNTLTSPKTDLKHSPNPQPSSLLRSPLSSARPSPSKLLPSSSQATNTDRPTFSPLAISPLATSSQSDSNSGGMNDKPTYSYAALIGQAINCSEFKKVCLNDIYAYIMHNYSYYRKDEAGWQNSIRHNLSLNESFIKLPRGPNEPGKGSFWAIAPGAEDQFVNGGFKKKSNPISTPQQVNRDPSQRRAKVAHGGSSVTKRVKSNEEESMRAGPSSLTATPTINISANTINHHHPISSAPRVPGIRTVSHANYCRSQQSSTTLSSSPQYASSPNRTGYHHSPTEDLMTVTMSRVKVGGIRHASSSATASSSPWNGTKESGLYKRSQGLLVEQDKWGTRNRETSSVHRTSLDLHHPHHQPGPSGQPIQSPSSSTSLSNPLRYPASLSLGHKKRRVGEGDMGSSPGSLRSISSINESLVFSKPILDETDQTFGRPIERNMPGTGTRKYSLPALPLIKRTRPEEMMMMMGLGGEKEERREEESLRLAPIIGGIIDDQELEKKRNGGNGRIGIGIGRNGNGNGGKEIRLSSVKEILSSAKHPFKSNFFGMGMGVGMGMGMGMGVGMGMGMGVGMGMKNKGLETPVSSFRSTVLNHQDHDHDQNSDSRGSRDGNEGEGEGEGNEGEGEGNEVMIEEKNEVEEDEDEIEIDEIED